jgi:quercetin dioxygenase-like cupin family protein
MHRVVSLIVIVTLILLSAGCLSESSHAATEDEGIYLLSPGEGYPIFDGQGHYAGLIGEKTPHIPANYSLGLVTIEPGNATALHRLMETSEMVCIIDGRAEIHCDATTVEVREGEVVVLPPGVLQSISAAGTTALRYIDVIDPPFSQEVEMSGDELMGIPVAPEGVPVVIPDPREGIEWDIGSDMVIYTVANPVLMPEQNLPITYSVAYAALLPGGSADSNRLSGASELIYVTAGEIEVFTPGGDVTTVPSGSAAWVAPGQVKGYRNAGAVNATMLSFVDPAWTPERTRMTR